MIFITGEKIQALCDHIIGVKENFEFNPNIYKLKKKLMNIHKINKFIDNKKYIFCYNTSRFSLDLLIKKLKYMKNNFILIFHNSDKNFNEKHLILFEQLPLLQYIYTQNMNVKHKKVFPLPIGLANTQWAHGNTKIHKEVYDIDIEKTKEIYFNFNVETNKIKRQECYNSIKKKNILWNKSLPYKKYLIELKKHKYAICPEGNGIDTHRFWECLYMNVIPICKKNILVEYYSKYFPIILLNEWDDLNLADLKYEFKKETNIFDMNYIINYINNR